MSHCFYARRRGSNEETKKRLRSQSFERDSESYFAKVQKSPILRGPVEIYAERQTLAVSGEPKV